MTAFKFPAFYEFEYIAVGDLVLMVPDYDYKTSSYNACWVITTKVYKNHIYVSNPPMLEPIKRGTIAIGIGEQRVDKSTGRGNSFSIFEDVESAREYFYRRQILEVILEKGFGANLYETSLDINENENAMKFDNDLLEDIIVTMGLKMPKKKYVKLPKMPTKVEGYEQTYIGDDYPTNFTKIKCPTNFAKIKIK